MLVIYVATYNYYLNRWAHARVRIVFQLKNSMKSAYKIKKIKINTSNR